MGGKKAGLPLSSLHISFLGSWVGWVSRWAAFMFPSFWAPGSDGWAAAQEAGLPLGSLHLGSGWAPLHVPFWVLGRMVRQRSFAPIALPSYFLSGLLSRMGGLRPRLGFRLGRGHASFLGSWSVRAPGGWAALAAGLHCLLSQLPSCFLFFLGSWVGWDGWAGAGLPSYFLSGRAAAKELGSH